MARLAIVVFTGRPREEILTAHGSGDWRLDLQRAEAAEFLVCTRNRHSREFAAAPEPHRAAFLIGRKAAIVPAVARPDRWVVKFHEYATCLIPDVWGKSGTLHLRYPVWYTSLEELGIALDDPGIAFTAPQPFKPAAAALHPPGFGEAPGSRLLAPPQWTPASRPAAAPEQDARARFDAILGQLDRIPDLPTAAAPLAWDQHGLPR